MCMKKKSNIINYLTAVLLGLVSLSSCNTEIEGELLKKVNMKIAFSAYQSLPKDSMPFTDKYFTPVDPAQKYIEKWLLSKYYSVGNGSVCDVSYDFRDYVKPSELKSLSNQQVIILTGKDYKLAWNNIISEFYTPEITPVQSIPVVLSANLTSDEGDFRIVEYNYSRNNPTILKNQEYNLFNESFSDPAYKDWGAINMPQWFMKTIEGAGRGWSTIFNKVATSPNAFSYNRTAGADNWLITQQAIDLSDGLNVQLSLDFGWGYYVSNEPFRFEVLITEAFDEENPLNSKWVNVTNQLLAYFPDQTTVQINEVTQKTLPSGGYPGIRNYLMKDLSVYHGKKIYIAFRDKLLPVKTDGSVYSTASLYFLDNIKVFDLKDKAISDVIEKQQAIFKFSSGKWMPADTDFYVLQSSDYPDPLNQTLDVENADEIISQLLDTKFQSSEGDQKIVVYIKPDMTTKADDYVFSSGAWKLNAPPITRITDRYLFNSSVGKWMYEKSL